MHFGIHSASFMLYMLSLPFLVRPSITALPLPAPESVDGRDGNLKFNLSIHTPELGEKPYFKSEGRSPSPSLESLVQPEARGFWHVDAEVTFLAPSSPSPPISEFGSGSPAPTTDTNVEEDATTESKNVQSAIKDLFYLAADALDSKGIKVRKWNGQPKAAIQQGRSVYAFTVSLTGVDMQNPKSVMVCKGDILLTTKRRLLGYTSTQVSGRLVKQDGTVIITVRNSKPIYKNEKLLVVGLSTSSDRGDKNKPTSEPEMKTGSQQGRKKVSFADPLVADSKGKVPAVESEAHATGLQQKVTDPKSKGRQRSRDDKTTIASAIA